MKLGGASVAAALPVEPAGVLLSKILNPEPNVEVAPGVAGVEGVSGVLDAPPAGLEPLVVVSLCPQASPAHVQPATNVANQGRLSGLIGR